MMKLYIGTYCAYQNTAMRPELSCFFFLAEDEQAARDFMQKYGEENLKIFNDPRYRYVHCIFEEQDPEIVKGLIASIEKEKLPAIDWPETI